MTHQSILKADVLLVTVAMVWGTSYGVTKSALQYVPVLVFLMLRFGITAFVLLPKMIQEFRQHGTIVAQCRIGIITGMVLLSIFLLEVCGIYLTKASNAAFLISLFVIFTPFIEWLILKKRPNNRIFVLAGICVIGASLITGGLSSPLNLGDSLIVIAGFLRAFMVVITKKLTNNQQISALILTGIQSLTVCWGALLLALLRGEDFTLPNQLSFWMLLLYLVVFCTLFAFLGQNYAVKLTTPSRVSILLGTEPVFGAIFALVWLNETIEVAAWLGGLLIVGSCLYMTLQNTEKQC